MPITQDANFGNLLTPAVTAEIDKILIQELHRFRERLALRIGAVVATCLADILASYKAEKHD